MQDQKVRCFANRVGQDLYAHYHDTEWGNPIYDDRLLFEMLTLEGAQSGLSWEIILKKREGYRNLFFNFDPVRVACLTDENLSAICQDNRIIRHRGKIFSVRNNAHIILKIQKQHGSFSNYLWDFVGGCIIKNNFSKWEDVPSYTKESIALSKDLKKRGMLYVGKTTLYSFMQACGMVNDHLTICWRYSL